MRRRHNLRHPIMRLVRQLPFAYRAVVVDVFVPFVAEEHGPADEADEALHHAD